MIYHHCSGGIIVNQAQEVLILHEVTYHGSLQYVPPKGHVEEGETPLESARREIEEECGLTKLQLLAELPEITYRWNRQRQLHEKTVIWYLFLYEGGEIVTPRKSEGFVDYSWVPIRQSMHNFTFRDLQPIIAEAMKALGLS